MTEDTVTIPRSMYDQFMQNSSKLEKILEVLSNLGYDNEDEEIVAQMGLTRKLQEWSIRYSGMYADYRKLQSLHRKMRNKNV